jgi:general secretion pathway protein D
LQVAIEATIAEVTLNNSLQYGVQYYLKNNVGSIGLSTSKAASGTPNTTPLVKTLPGFNLLLGSEADPKAILTALSGRTNVKVLSTPSLVVLDNQAATLQVGDQVPVSTTQATLISGGATDGFPVANNIDYRNTGVILRVLPRVAANGNVTLDVDQEISNVANAANSSTLTPTISQRRVRSSIAVSSGQTVLLAGLISDREQAGREGIPFLERITLLGDLFATNTSTLNRTELIIFIKPQIIRDAVDAQAIAEEMRSKMTAKPSSN